MNLPELKSLLRQLLIEDLDKALQTAKSTLPEASPKARQVLLLVGQQADLKKSIARGIVDPADIELRTNKIRSVLIDLVESLEHRDLEAPTGTIAPVLAACPKFVIVYAPEDQAAATLLNRHLNVLKLTKKIKVYNVNEALGGENPLERAEQEWADADYMLALITVGLFNAPDWFEMVYNALGEGRRVIPILIQRADFEGTGLEKLKSLPRAHTAVSDFANVDEAYTDIVSEIRRLLPKG